jgi:hypothetical protein
LSGAIQGFLLEFYYSLVVFWERNKIALIIGLILNFALLLFCAIVARRIIKVGKGGLKGMSDGRIKVSLIRNRIMRNWEFEGRKKEAI